MQLDWHTSDTRTEIIVRQMFRRPKVALRRITDPLLRLAVKSWDLNRGKQAGPKAWEYVEQLLRRG